MHATQSIFGNYKGLSGGQYIYVSWKSWCGVDLLGIRTIPEQPGSTLAPGDKILNHICFGAKMQIVNLIN